MKDNIDKGFYAMTLVFATTVFLLGALVLVMRAIIFMMAK